MYDSLYNYVFFCNSVTKFDFHKHKSLFFIGPKRGVMANYKNWMDWSQLTFNPIQYVLKHLQI